MLNFKKIREFELDTSKGDFEEVLGIDKKDYVAKMAYVTKLVSTGRHDPMEVAELIGQYMTLEELVLSTLSLAVMANEKSSSMLDKKIFKMSNDPRKVSEMLDKIKDAKSEEEIAMILKAFSAEEVDPSDVKGMVEKLREDDDNCPNHSIGTDN